MSPSLARESYVTHTHTQWWASRSLVTDSPPTHRLLPFLFSSPPTYLLLLLPFFFFFSFFLFLPNRRRERSSRLSQNHCSSRKRNRFSLASGCVAVCCPPPCRQLQLQLQPSSIPLFNHSRSPHPNATLHISVLQAPLILQTFPSSFPRASFLPTRPPPPPSLTPPHSLTLPCRRPTLTCCSCSYSQSHRLCRFIFGASARRSRLPSPSTTSALQFLYLVCNVIQRFFSCRNINSPRRYEDDASDNAAGSTDDDGDPERARRELGATRLPLKDPFGDLVPIGKGVPLVPIILSFHAVVTPLAFRL